MAIVDLNQLAAPDVVETLDYETILSERKATLVSRRGQAWAESRLQELVKEAEALLAPFSHRAGILIETAHFIANRRN